MYKLMPYVFVGFLIGASQPQSAQSQPGSSPAGGIPFDTPFAKYGDIEIGLGEFFFFQDRMLKEIDNYEDEERKEQMMNALQNLIFEFGIYNLAMEQGYGQTPEYLSQVQDMKNGYLAAFYTYHQFTTQYEEDEDALRALYEEEKEKYFQPAKFTFRHIFIRTVDMPEEEQKKADDRAKAALELIKSGSDFVEIARMYSDSERKGAVVGPFNKRGHDPDRAINPVLEDALMELEQGEVSDIITTKYGYEILKLESFTDDQYRPFAQLRLTLANRLKSEQREDWKRSIVEEYWDDAVSQFNPSVIFDENADMNDVIAVVYSDVINYAKYQQLVTRKLTRNPNESDEEYNKRLVDQLKYDVIFNNIAAKLAWEKNYSDIPRYKLLTKFKEYKSVYSVWWNKMVDNYMDANPVTEEEKRAYYEENKNYFLAPSKAYVREMMFKVPEHAEDVMYEKYKAEQAAKEKAQKAIERVLAGENFAEVAKDMSESGTAGEGGDIGEIGFDTDKLPKMVAREAMKLNPTGITEEPVRDGDKFYVVQCYKKPPREPLDFNDPLSQERLERAVPNVKRNEYYQTMLNRLADIDEIEILYENAFEVSPTGIAQTSLYLPGMERPGSNQ